MNKLKITDNINSSKAQVEVGQFYKDTSRSRYGHGRVYIVAEFYGVANIWEFALVEVSTGECYTSGTIKIDDIFNGDKSDFELIENVEIIIS
jgi:hypothetical protein